MADNLLVVHGGGPTAVINASLKGIIDEAKRHDEIAGIFGAAGGVDGIFDERFIDLGRLSDDIVEMLPYTPASFIGTSRRHLEDSDYETIVAILRRHNIRYLLLNGGNGTMDTCNKIHNIVKDKGDIVVVGVPKTVDNDLAITDHCPGYGSAARYAAVSVAEAGLDVAALPIHVCIIELMGRNAGWIAAASALARRRPGDAPHLIYLPERPFVEEEFLRDVKQWQEQKGGVVVVVAEGLVGPDGKPIVAPVSQTKRDAYSSDVSAYLVRLIMDKLNIRARSEKPGILGRSSIALQSSTDRQEAEKVGAAAVKAAAEGRSGYMVTLKRLSSTPYECVIDLVALDKVGLIERHVPDEYIAASGNDVTSAFIEYCKPLIGDLLPQYAVL